MRREASTGPEVRALSQHWREQRVRLRIPVLSGRPPPSLHERRPNGEREATRGTVLALMSEWQAQGCPGLIKAIQHTHQVIHSAAVSEHQRQLARQAITKIFEGEPHGGPNE